MPISRKLAPLFLLLSTTVIATVNPPAFQTMKVFGSNPLQGVQQRVQPLDPLTPEEIELAKQLANADRRVKAALGSGRQRLIQVDFFAMKPADTSTAPQRMQMGRHARVLFYRYEGDRGIDVVVDLERRTVASVTQIEGVAVPLAADEIADAFNVAIRNAGVRSLLGPRLNEFRVAGLTTGEQPETRVEGLRVIATAPRDPCYRRRCVYLMFRDQGRYLAGTKVTVNLTAQTTRVERTAR